MGVPQRSQVIFMKILAPGPTLDRPFYKVPKVCYPVLYSLRQDLPHDDIDRVSPFSNPFTISV